MEGKSERNKFTVACSPPLAVLRLSGPLPPTGLPTMLEDAATHAQLRDSLGDGQRGSLLYLHRTKVLDCNIKLHLCGWHKRSRSAN